MDDGIILINHPLEYREGVRVMLLTGRNKDKKGIEQRKVFRISHNVEQFSRYFDELVALSEYGERIYVSSSTRSLQKAQRAFKIKMLNADFDPNYDFFRNLNANWISCLMQPSSQEDKRWIIDCDVNGGPMYFTQIVDKITAYLSETNIKFYTYQTKTGRHFVTEIFNRNHLDDTIKRMLHTNDYMLWAYYL